MKNHGNKGSEPRKQGFGFGAGTRCSGSFSEASEGTTELTVLNNIFIGLGGKAMITGGAGWEGTRTNSAEDLHDVGYRFDGEPSRSGTDSGPSFRGPS